MNDKPRSQRSAKAPPPKIDREKPKDAGASPKTIESVSTAALPCLECPPELSPIAREEWNRIVGELTALGVLSKFDRGPLAVYCEACATWAEATDAIHKYGAMIKSPTGYPVQSPWVAIANRAAETILRIAGEFGFTPAARSRSFSYSKSQSMLLEIAQKNDDDPSDW
jgi:P27 family predicted phage terminase small subunit